MKSISQLRRAGLIVAVATLIPFSEAGAQLWEPLAPAERECVIQAGNNFVEIFAGNGVDFPKVVSNTNDPLCPGTCHQWDYMWVYHGFNGSQSVVSVDSAVRVIDSPDNPILIFPPDAADPTPFDSSVSFGNVAGELGLRFPHNGAVYNARFYTDTATAVGTVTAGFKSGGRNGFCAIAGAVAAPAGDPLLSRPTSFTTETLGCTVQWTQTPDGCVSAAITSTPGCTIETEELKVNNVAVTTASCGTETAGPTGSTQTCRWNSILRRLICVTVDDD